MSDPRREETEEAVVGEQMKEDAGQSSTTHQAGVDAEQQRERKDSVVPLENPPVMEDRRIESAKRNPEKTEDPEKQQKSQTQDPAPADALKNDICSSESQVGLLHPLLFS